MDIFVDTFPISTISNSSCQELFLSFENTCGTLSLTLEVGLVYFVDPIHNQAIPFSYRVLSVGIRKLRSLCGLAGLTWVSTSHGSAPRMAGQFLSPRRDGQKLSPRRSPRSSAKEAGTSGGPPWASPSIGIVLGSGKTVSGCSWGEQGPDS